MTSTSVDWARGESRPRARAIQAAGMLVAAILATGLVARLVGFATAPMSPNEAALALSSYGLTLGRPPEIWADPTQQTLTTALFFLFGASDGIARALPLITGLVVVWLGWRARSVLGETGLAIAASSAAADTPTTTRSHVTAGAIAAGLLALSALSVDASRHLGGESVAMALGLGTVLIWLQLRAAPSMALLRLLAVAFGALLLAGAAGFQTGAILLALALVASFRQPDGPDGATLRRMVSSRVATSLWLVPLLATIGVLSTCLLLFPAGVGLPSIGAWGARFETDPQPVSALYPAVALIVYEPAILVLAIVGAWLGLRRATPGRGLVMFLTSWSAGEIGLAWLATTKTTGALTPALVPLALLAGIGGSALLERGRTAISRLNQIAAEGANDDDLIPAGWRAVAIAVIPLLIAVGFAYTVLGFFTQAGGLFKEFGPPAILIAAILLGGLLWVAIQRLRRDSGAVLGLVAVALTMIAGVHATSALNYGTRAELARPARPSPEAKRLADRVVDVANRLRSKQVTIAVDPQLREPFAWYLRQLENVSYNRAYQAGPTVVVLLDPAPPSSNQAGPFAAYQSHRARLSGPTTDGLETPTAWLRWWAFREGPAGSPTIVGYFSRQ